MVNNSGKRHNNNSLENIKEHKEIRMRIEKWELITQRSVVQIHPPQPTPSTTYERPRRLRLDLSTFLSTYLFTPPRGKRSCFHAEERRRIRADGTLEHLASHRYESLRQRHASRVQQCQRTPKTNDAGSRPRFDVPRHSFLEFVLCQRKFSQRYRLATPRRKQQHTSESLFPRFAGGERRTSVPTIFGLATFCATPARRSISSGKRTPSGHPEQRSGGRHGS